jgi:putative SOS response-associated peptidase YedK
MARWGMPSPLFALKGRNSDSGVTNIRNVKSPHWRRWLGIEHRCVVPFTSSVRTRHCLTAESLRSGSRSMRPGPLAFFAGIWTGWTSVRKVKEGETTNASSGSSPPNPTRRSARSIRKQCRILTTRHEIDLWMTAPAGDAFKLQRPLADGALMIVARGEKTDEGGLAA